MDTSTSYGSVAVVDGANLVGEVRLRTGGTHSHSLMPAVAFVLESLGFPASSLDGFAVVSGPGSFTGLRVGLSTVQGLALAASKPCLGVSALDVLAVRMRGAAPCLVAMMDAYRDEVYAGVYDRDGIPQGSLFAAGPAAVLERVPEEAAFLGDGALRYRDEILRLRPQARFPARSLFLAGTLGLLAEPRLRAGEGGDARALRPLYLRAPHIRPPGA